MSASPGAREEQGRARKRKGEIEFASQDCQAGIDIMHHFVKVMRQRCAESPAHIRISQEELTLRMIIETDDGHREVIEQSLNKSGSGEDVDGVIHIGLGRAGRLPDNRYVHRCGNCAMTWLSSHREPKQCPRSRDDRRGAKCAMRKWRMVTDRGQEVARQQKLALQQELAAS